METTFSARNDLVKIRTATRRDCAKLDVGRYWRHRADAYTKDRFGNWWGDARDHRDTLQCG